MANFICEFEGVRGRNLKLYDTKIIITTKKTVGSLITGNFTDGEKTIYLCDVVGVQFKKSGGLIGYLQFETPSMQMNNKSDNMFSENTFTYEHGKNGITNKLMIALYNFVTDRIEELKYSTAIINETPDFEAMKIYEQNKENGEEIEHEFGEKIKNESTVSDENNQRLVHTRKINYSCINIIPTGKKSHGTCAVCKSNSVDLEENKINTEIGTRILNICETCINEFSITATKK